MTQRFHHDINIDQVKELCDDCGVKGLDGTGPFCFQSWEPRNELILTKHEGYNWGPEFYANKGPAKVDKVVWKIVPEDNNRSEEHTSELQSLMRISYTVFCLKKTSKTLETTSITEPSTAAHCARDRSTITIKSAEQKTERK